MINNKIKFSFLGASLALILAGCSKDDSSTGSNEKENSGVLSNNEMTLTYGKSLLNHNVENKNSLLAFDRLAPNVASARTALSVQTYNPDLTGFTAISGSNSIEITQNGKFYIAEGVTFSGNINFNGSGTLIVLGNLISTSTINVPNGGIVNIGANATFGSGSSIHLNSGSQLNNYGTFTYRSGSVDGTINNFNNLVFDGSDVNLNGSSTVNNNCKVTFKKRASINGTINNRAYANFENGFHINGSALVNLEPGTLTDFSGGQISIDGKIKNTVSSSAYARIDITGNTSIGNMNATPAFIGNLDINTTLDIPVNKRSSEVKINDNMFIAANDCMPQRGTVPTATCNDNTLAFTLVSNVISPKVGATTLSATDVKVVNGFAYVSYHTNDEVYGDAPNGSLRVFNVQNSNSTDLVAEANFNNAEFNGIDIYDNKVYAVGGNKAGARMFVATLNQGTFNPDLAAFSPFKLPSVSAKNSYVENNNIWIASGNSNGGVFKLSASNNYASTPVFEKTGAKYVAHNSTKQAFFAVENNAAFLRIAGLDGSGAVEYTYPNLKQNIKDGKNVITMDNDYVYVALSDKGVAKFSLENGNMVSHFIPNEYRVNGNKIFNKNGYSNAVSIDNCYLYIANGADGVIVLNKDTFNVVGSFKLSDSANFVYAKDGFIFVATGRDGLNIIRKN